MQFDKDFKEYLSEIDKAAKRRKIGLTEADDPYHLKRMCLFKRCGKDLEYLEQAKGIYKKIYDYYNDSYSADVMNSYNTPVHDFLRNLANLGFVERDALPEFLAPNNKKVAGGIQVNYQVNNYKPWEECILENYNWFHNLFKGVYIKVFI